MQQLIKHQYCVDTSDTAQKVIYNLCHPQKTTEAQ